MALNSDALRVFLGVVDAGSLSAAAELLGQTASGVSRALSRLEEDLGVMLLNRTTRRMELTEEGARFLPKARQIVASLEEAEECMRMVHQRPAGRLRVDASVPVMLHCVVPHVGEFRREYPEISLELTSNDRIVDLMEHRTDIAIRMGPLTDSTLHARVLRPSPRWMMASPEYIARHGAPETVEDLAKHEVLGFTQPESLNLWPLKHAGGTSYQATPTLATSSGETQRQLALRGVGIACLSDFVVREDIAAGRLVKVMEGVYSDQLQPMHAVYHRNTQLSRRIACFLDFFAGRV
ncbi:MULTISPECIES: LysR family transcriptional regulator [Achromobacter]|uniref:LysR family transcriptional regulator n=1 Tax=Achromobacter spanius TaxID=217203 RepID=A0ABY8GMY1_9BURK|nr:MULTISPECIES: LysR family transcriptional regulator [Achromobacter]WAI84715.1 LysR family transcriptional regulator [Achromobacter spanius]WEX94799.1 LysR family transcriptional regulator [Achromobacter sp. SS2-2022]WFP06037.1 LysR family transcriptional regulator [Achromobacter spanius]